jgi:hypothetical protein
MQFGLNFFPCVDPAEKSAEQYFPEAIYLAGLTDELGYTHVRRLSTTSSRMAATPLIFLTAVAQRTTKVRLITGGTAGVQFTAEDGRRIGCLTGSAPGGLRSVSPARSCRTSSHSQALASTRADAASPRGWRK